MLAALPTRAGVPGPRAAARPDAGGAVVDETFGLVRRARSRAHSSCRAETVLPVPKLSARRVGRRGPAAGKGRRLPMSFDPVAFLAAFAVIFLAELPDKTMFASLAMGTRMRPLWVWLGTSSAFLVHVVIAVAAGSLFALLPKPLVQTVAAALFAFGAYTLLKGDGEEDDEESGTGPRVLGTWATYATAFTVVFISEWGDLTQITTANLAAARQPLPVALGALLALVSVSALALRAGRFIAERVPLAVVRRLGGLVMVVLALWSLSEAFFG